MSPQASQGNRRGAVFAVRVTEEERGALEELRQDVGGPRALGPWLLWRALAGESPSRYCRAGAVVPSRSRRETSSGITRAGEDLVVPGPGSASSRYCRDVPVAQRVILDLCAGSGSWSRPYEEAGYPVRRLTLPEGDVRTFNAITPFEIPGAVTWGILCAPPCDQFSLARNGHEGRESVGPRDFVRGMECVNACLRIVFQARPVWWALENPVGLLGEWLGRPRDVFDPFEYGDPWTKRTALWGDFAIPKRGPFVEPRGGGPFCAVCDPSRRRSTWCSNSAHRAITPEGFARAFKEANP